MKIESTKYYGGTGSANMNVLYRDNKGVLQLARVYVCFFNKAVYFPKQEKDAKSSVSFQKFFTNYADNIQQYTSFAPPPQQ